MIKELEEFELKPINNRFKNLIDKFGNKWLSLCNPTPMHCFNGEMAITASPINNGKKCSNFRIKDIQA